MLRVKNLDKSIEYYTRLLGMKLLRRNEFPQGKFTLAFVGYGPEDSHAVIELTFNCDKPEGYEPGTAYGQIALGVRDIYGVCEELEKSGANITRKPRADDARHDTYRLCQNPDGYKIELIDLGTMD